LGLWDVVAGSSATLLAAWCTSKMPNIWLAALPPVLINMMIIGGMLHFLLEEPLLITILYIGAGQFVACCLVGIPLMRALERRGIFERYSELK
jgi:uncharacterized membrane protein